MNTTRCAFYGKKGCRYGDKCRYVHATDEEWKELKEKHRILKAQEKLLKDQEKADRIKKIIEDSLATRPDKCLRVKFTFIVNTCEDWGSGCGCKECDSDLESEHEQEEYIDLIGYISLPDDTELWKKKMESYENFISGFNFIGRGSKGKITINESTECKVTEKYRITEYEHVEFLMENGEYGTIVEGFPLPGGYSKAY